MKRLDETYFVYQNNRLVKRWHSVVHGKTYSQGKRMPLAFDLLTDDERRSYVKHGLVQVVKMIMARKSCGLREALDVLRKAKGNYLVINNPRPGGDDE